MGKYRFEASIEWARGPQSPRPRSMPMDFFSPYRSWGRTPESRSDYCINDSQLAHLELVIRQNRAFTIVVPEADGHFFLQIGQHLRIWERATILLNSYEGKRQTSSLSFHSLRQPAISSQNGKMTVTVGFNA